MQGGPPAQEKRPTKLFSLSLINEFRSRISRRFIKLLGALLRKERAAFAAPLPFFDKQKVLRSVSLIFARRTFSRARGGHSCDFQIGFQRFEMFAERDLLRLGRRLAAD